MSRSVADETTSISMQDAARFARAIVEERERERLTIALVGRGGAGKSSLINKLIGRKVCAVGPKTDETQKPEKHEWNQVVFVDLPGYGTRKFSLQRVMEEFEIKSFDMFLWCADSKFLEEDLSVYEELKRTGKPILFVRTKCDDIYDTNEEKTPDALEEEISADLRKLIKYDAQIFFVSSQAHYPKYRERLARLISAIEASARDASKAKEQIVHRDFQAFTGTFLKKKRSVVEDMVTAHALIAAANGVNPVPGLNIGVDIANVVKMLDRISTAYGIDEIAKVKVLGDQPTWVLSARSLVGMLATDGAMSLLRSVGGRVAAQQFARYIPILGMIVSAGLGYYIVRDSGLKFVEECHTAAEAYLQDALRRS
jgi:small GTP-binding protein